MSQKRVLPDPDEPMTYLFILWACLKLGTAYRLAPGADFAHKLMGLGQSIGPALPGLGTLHHTPGIFRKTSGDGIGLPTFEKQQVFVRPGFVQRCFFHGKEGYG